MLPAVAERWLMNVWAVGVRVFCSFPFLSSWRI